MPTKYPNMLKTTRVYFKVLQKKRRKNKEEERDMGSFGRINEFLALVKCLEPWDWLFSPNEVDEGGKTKVRGLKLRVT